MARSHAILRILRLIHLYVGVFIAPALVFFAFTGALQTFSFHETVSGSSYTPPKWAVVLAQIHKKQTPVVPQKKSAPPVAAARRRSQNSLPDPTVEQPRLTHNPLPLKIFFLLVAIGLFVSTLSGLYMSWKYARNRIAILAMLAAGVVIPVAMVLA